MLSEFQTQKIKKLFEWSDFNNNGYLEKDDYITVGKRMAAARDWAEDSAEYAMLNERLLADWKATEQFADTDNDNRVSWTEWLAFCDHFVNTPPVYEVAVTNIAEAFFAVGDTDGDGSITREDWQMLFQVYGQPDEVAGESFRYLDQNGNGQITLEEIQDALRVFFTSEDRSEPANFFFGVL